MGIHLKKSKIKYWWIAKSNNLMAFENILGANVKDMNLLVVGYVEREKRELWTSSNKVSKVTKEGITTAKGTFYPFSEAHPLYLQFLIETSNKSTIIAKNWNSTSGLGKLKITADITSNGVETDNVTFDFTPVKEYGAVFLGYSKKLNANVVVTTFDKRNVCIKLKVPDEVVKNIYTTSFLSEKELSERVHKVQALVTASA